MSTNKPILHVQFHNSEHPGVDAIVEGEMQEVFLGPSGFHKFYGLGKCGSVLTIEYDGYAVNYQEDSYIRPVGGLLLRCIEVPNSYIQGTPFIDAKKNCLGCLANACGVLEKMKNASIQRTKGN